MPQHPVPALAAALEHYGLSAEALEDMLYFCEHRQSGTLTLHFEGGRFVCLETYARLPLGIRTPPPGP
jgi:hypothetical protein